jgi:HEAT repeat protein
MMADNEFHQKMNDLNFAESDVVESVVKDLGEKSEKRAIPYLIEMLPRVNDVTLRDTIALALGKLRANDAVPEIIKLIRKPELRNKRGSLVYALKNLDCRNYFAEIVEMLRDGNYEVCSHAIEIFDSLIDKVSYSERLLAFQALSAQEALELSLPPSNTPKYDRIHFIRAAIKALDY